jgi:hypothetical protein
LACPASRGERGHSRAGRPGRNDFPVPAAVAPTWRPSGALRRPRAGLGPGRFTATPTPSVAWLRGGREGCRLWADSPGVRFPGAIRPKPVGSSRQLAALSTQHLPWVSGPCTHDYRA